MRMRAVEAQRLLEADGWFEVPSKGGHRQFKHATKPGKATIPFHRGDLSPVVIKGLERQTGLTLRKR